MGRFQLLSGQRGTGLYHLRNCHPQRARGLNQGVRLISLFILKTSKAGQAKVLKTEGD
jgi:hypothetical protein